MSDLVGNPEDRFALEAAHFVYVLISADVQDKTAGGPEIHDVTYDTSQMPFHLQLFNVLLQVAF